jgi:hypothetical protein
MGRRLQAVKEVFKSVAEQTKIGLEINEEKTNFMRVPCSLTMKMKILVQIVLKQYKTIHILVQF